MQATISCDVRSMKTFFCYFFICSRTRKKVIGWGQGCSFENRSFEFSSKTGKRIDWSLCVLNYSQTCPNDHLQITATCQQRPVCSPNGQPEATDLFHINLYITATFVRSQGWPLYTGLTVCFNGLILTT